MCLFFEPESLLLVIFPIKIFTQTQRFVYNDVAAFLFVILQTEST